MNPPTWATVFAAMSVGLILGQTIGIIVGMFLEERLNKWERTIEDMDRRRREGKDRSL